LKLDLVYDSLLRHYGERKIMPEATIKFRRKSKGKRPPPQITSSPYIPQPYVPIIGDYRPFSFKTPLHAGPKTMWS